jgi:hypothetical protein
MTTTIARARTGVCRGCFAEKMLMADGTIGQHLLPLELRFAPTDHDPCPGVYLPPRAEETVPLDVEPAELPTAPVALAVEEPAKPPVLATISVCVVCGRSGVRRTSDGRLADHRLPAEPGVRRMHCDGGGRFPREVVL